MIDPFDPHIPFDEKALRIYELQREYNPVYEAFCKALGVNQLTSVEDIPLLPIQAFKEAEVITADKNSKFNIQNSEFFQSSGTSGMSRSRHYLPYPEIYRESILKGMNHFYNLEEYVIWAYTPGYIDNPHSSLIRMLNTLIENDASGMSRFLEIGLPFDSKAAEEVKEAGRKLMLFGAAFGLLDLAPSAESEQSAISVIMETGGMKTHRREMTKAELHRQLAQGFGLDPTNIHSEYGMTEMLSQAYSLGEEWFEVVPWLHISIRDPKDPMSIVKEGEEGLIGVMDLANLHSCSFILTGDKGVMRSDGKFRVLGRWNPMNLRGCNFLIDTD